VALTAERVHLSRQDAIDEALEHQLALTRRQLPEDIRHPWIGQGHLLHVVLGKTTIARG
jgi:hypothetical protein